MIGLGGYQLKLYPAAPSRSEIIDRLSDMIRKVLYLQAVLGVAITLAFTANGITTRFWLILLIIAVWSPTITFFIIGQYSLSNIITNAKWQKLNQIQTRVERLEAEANIEDKDTMETINRLMEYHNQILKTPNEVLKAYRIYYKKFNKTYHVQLQLESVVQKGKSLPNVSPLVDANFVAELETLILTAGHDADLLETPVTIDATQGGEAFIQMNGSAQTLKPDDMMMSDGKGVVCTIIYGQDQRTPISPNTRRALYVAYAPAGIPVAMVQQQLDSIRENVLLFAPEAGRQESISGCEHGTHQTLT